MPPPGKFKGCGRGIFALESWDPLPRPADLEERFAQMKCNVDSKEKVQTETQSDKSGDEANQPTPNGQAQKTAEKKAAPNNNPAGLPNVGQKMIGKYNYKANPGSPLGGPELDIKQGEHLTFVEAHDDHWWLAENESGEKGFVPASYVMPMEEKVTSLPWLKNTEPEPEEKSDARGNRFGAPENYKAPVKPYRPTYKHDGLPQKEESSKQYFCEVCQKQLNGPMPYKAHMNSKAHKEEVEIAAAYNS